MSEWEIVRHQVAIAGRVTDAQTHRAIGGAWVRIIGAPEPFTSRLITWAKLVALQDVVTNELRTVLDDREESLTNKLQAAQVMLDYDWLITRAGPLGGEATAQLCTVLKDSSAITQEKLRDARAIVDPLLYRAGWSATPQRPDLTRTAPDGHFHFLDLADGEYTLRACLPSAGTRYGVAYVAATVSRDANDNIVLSVPVSKEDIGTGDGKAKTFKLAKYPVVTTEETFEIRVDGEKYESATLSNDDKNYVSRVTLEEPPQAEKLIEGDYIAVRADLALPPTALKGRITAQEEGQVKPVAMAEVRIVGSGERTFSDTGRPDDDTKGDYLLTGLEAGKRTVVVSAQGYSDASHVVTIEKAGQVVTGVDLTLTSSKASRRSSRR